VAVTHEGGWCLGIYPGWRVVREHLDEPDIQPRHLDIGHDRAEALRLMNAGRGLLNARTTAPASGLRARRLTSAASPEARAEVDAEPYRSVPSCVPQPLQTAL
jgi:hypothetical protein